MKSRIIIVVALTAMFSSQAFAVLVASTPKAVHVPVAIWAIFGCTTGVVSAAVVANYLQHRQLTAYEAGTCGAAFWLSLPKPR